MPDIPSRILRPSAYKVTRDFYKALPKALGINSTLEVVSDFGDKRFYISVGLERSDLHYHILSASGWVTVHFYESPPEGASISSAPPIGQFQSYIIELSKLTKWFHDQGFENKYSIHDVTDEPTYSNLPELCRVVPVRFEFRNFFKYKKEAQSEAEELGIPWNDAFPFFINHRENWVVEYIRSNPKLRLLILDLLLNSQSLD